MLIFPLKKEWFEKIERGEKTIEYREAKPYWTKRLNHEGISVSKKVPYDFKKLQERVQAFLFPPECFLQLGYTKKRLQAAILRVEIVDGWNTDLHFDGDVYAIYFKVFDPRGTCAKANSCSGFEQWLASQGYLVRDDADMDILRDIYDAMDDEDK